MTTYTVDVDISGPLFNGRAQSVVTEVLAETVGELAEEGRGMLGIRFIHDFKEPTGYYESRVEAQRVTSELTRIHDNGVVYGPWLEGTGSRNFPVTRFKGYHAFREVTAELQRRAPAVCGRVLARRIGAIR